MIMQTVLGYFSKLKLNHSQENSLVWLKKKKATAEHVNKPNNINRKSGKKSVLVWVSGYTLDCCYDCHVSLKTSVMNLIQVFGSGWAGGIGVGSHRRTVWRRRRRRETRKTQQQQGRRAPGHDGRPLTHLSSLWLFDDRMVNLHCEL